MTRERASVDLRGGALAADILILALPAFIFVLAITAGKDSASALVTMDIIIVVGVLLYFAIFNSRRGIHNGQTPGKQIMRIRTVRQDGRPVGPVTAVLRDVLRTILFIPAVLYLLVRLVVRRGGEPPLQWWDRICRTDVVPETWASIDGRVEVVGDRDPVTGEVPTGPLLETDGLTKIFGGLTAVNDVTFQVPRGSIVSIIGPNGAGKTTFFNMLTGLYKPSFGSVRFNGRDITAGRPDRITKAGVSRTFQNIRLFGTMTAVENVMVGEHARLQSGVFGAVFHPPWTRREERDGSEKARELLSYVGINRRLHDQIASNLSYGDQRRVEIARALSSDPRLLLLDEPTAGMNPSESAELTDFMRKVRTEKNLSILLIEHDMKVVMGVSEQITVIDHGEKIAEGDPQAVRNDPRVIEAYLGKGAAA